MFVNIQNVENILQNATRLPITRAINGTNVNVANSFNCFLSSSHILSNSLSSTDDVSDSDVSTEDASEGSSSDAGCLVIGWRRHRYLSPARLGMRCTRRVFSVFADYFKHLHVHKTSKPLTLALSVLPATSPLRHPSSIAGWLSLHRFPTLADQQPSLEEIVNVTKRYTDDVFQESPAFMMVLHDIVAQHGSHQDHLLSSAEMQGSGWIHVADERKMHQWGKTPSPEDIIGSFRVHDGKILAETYTKMPTYRLITARHGAFQLSDRLMDALITRINDMNGSS